MEEIFNSCRTTTITKPSAISHDDNFITQVKVVDRMGYHDNRLFLLF